MGSAEYHEGRVLKSCLRHAHNLVEGFLLFVLLKFVLNRHNYGEGIGTVGSGYLLETMEVLAFSQINEIMFNCLIVERRNDYV